MIKNKIKPRHTFIRNIFHGASYLSSFKRQWLTSLWGAELHNVYSSTEIIGRAVEDEEGYFVFQPFNVVEVYDPWSREVIDEGIGLVMVTCLYPFVQLQPRIRYLTNDFVMTTKAADGQTKYKFIGRLENAACECIDGRCRPSIPPVFLYDILDSLEGICRQPTSEDMNRLGGDISSNFGRPVFKSVFVTLPPRVYQG